MWITKFVSLYTILISSQNLDNNKFGQLVFQDEFVSDSLDTNKWEYQTGCSEAFGAGNLQCYVKGTNNIKLHGGIMKISAKIQNIENKNFTSGRILQRGDGYLYGYFVVRARLPKGNHLWPALWLLKRNNCYQEIDILEAKGDYPLRVIFSAHYGLNFRSLVKHSTANNTRIDFSKDFHNFGILWSKEKLGWYIDDVLYFEVSLDRDNWTTLNKTGCIYDPFSQPMNFIINLGVGGTFFNKTPFTPEQAEKSWTKPNLEVDWVRIYQK